MNLQAKSAKLELYERVTNVIATGISSSIIIGFALFTFLFASFGLAFWLSEVFESNKLGFFAVGGIYALSLGIYLLLKDKLAKNKVKNAVLLKVSKSHNDYDLLLKEQTILNHQVVEKEKLIKENFEELKENLETLRDDFKKLKSNFVTEGESDNTVGPRIPRLAITSLIDLVMQKTVLKNSGFIKKAVLPFLANALVTSTIFKENKQTSLVENLKLKFSKLIG